MCRSPEAIVDDQEEHLEKLKKRKNAKAHKHAQRAADLREQINDGNFGRLAYFSVL